MNHPPGLTLKYKCINCKTGVYYQMTLCTPCHQAWEAEKLATAIEHSPDCHVEGCTIKPTARKTVMGRNGYLCKKHECLGHDSPEA